MQKKRLFVGIPLSAPLRKRLAQEMRDWPEQAVLRTSEENLHVTLFFLGFIQEEALPKICATVEEVCQNTEAFELSFNGITLVGDAASPKMIWLAGEQSEHLRKLLEDLEKKFSAFITERKTYRPHVTLAKIKKSQWLRLAEKPKLKESLVCVESVDAVSLFESVAIDGKRRYVEIDVFPLQ